MNTILLTAMLTLASFLPLSAQNASPSPTEGGPFKPTRESLQQYRCPEWFRDAKFGIWSHWGPQSVPGNGDWYARFMYVEGYPPYEYHLKTYGHPSKFGYKDIVQLWKAAKFDASQAQRLMEIYKKAGAKYFVSMGVHHDNFDLWNSKHHKWNAVNMGPHKDIVGIWAAAARKEGLRFGVSEHLERSYSWFNTNKGADTKGPFAGVPYDGNDPAYADFYFPPHKDSRVTYPVDPPEWWPQQWRDRIADLIDSYHPDLLYTDGAIPFGEVGRSFVAHFYNANMHWHGGKLEAVYNIKDIPDHGEYIKGAAVQDMERGVMDGINPEPWQTCTSMGDWFYRNGQKYKSSADVLRMLADIVSKNGNLLINVVQTPDGDVEPELLKTLDEIGAWMAVNGEAIFGTRPWEVFGESPASNNGGSGGAYNEGNLQYSANDIRFTTKGDVLYAICLGTPTGNIRIASLGSRSNLADKTVAGVDCLGGSDKIQWKQEGDALVIIKPSGLATQSACVFKIALGTPVPGVCSDSPKPYGPTPSVRQLKQQRDAFHAFIHFTVNTFTDKEWGDGSESESVFNPTDFNADRIVSTVKDAGMKGLVITAKHHDGFCLWPTKTTKHSVANSPWKNGKGDIVRELSDACKRAGIKFGIYVSPWDRNHADYGKPGYVAAYHEQLRELLSDYGPIFEVWFDGANAGSGYYGGANEKRTVKANEYYDWPAVDRMIRSLQPDAIIQRDLGPDGRWGGNENGSAGDPCWATLLNKDLVFPTTMESKRNLNGERAGDLWMPSEMPVSIRKGWFYHDSESPKPLPELQRIWLESIGRGANLLFNLAPDRRGRIADTDRKALAEFRRWREKAFGTNLLAGAALLASNVRGGSEKFGPGKVCDNDPETFWGTDDNMESSEVIADFGKETKFNRVKLGEYLPLGQRIDKFGIDAWAGGKWWLIGEGTSVGNCRIVSFKTVRASKVRLRIAKASACPALSDVGVYLDESP